MQAAYQDVLLTSCVGLQSPHVATVKGLTRLRIALPGRQLNKGAGSRLSPHLPKFSVFYKNTVTVTETLGSMAPRFLWLGFCSGSLPHALSVNALTTATFSSCRYVFWSQLLTRM